MDRAKLLSRIVPVLLILDLAWLLALDLPALLGRGPIGFLLSKGWVEGCVLRPAILIGLALLVQDTRPAVNERFSRLISTGLGCAAAVELVQNLGPVVQLPTFGVVFLGIATAAVYGLYIAAFLAVGGRPSGPGWAGFVVVAAYGLLMFWILKVFDRGPDVLVTAVAYSIAASLLVGSALLRVIRGESGNSALLAGGGALLLLVSDSVRAISVFRFSNTFPLSEFLILVLFFGGQYCIARSVRADSPAAA